MPPHQALAMGAPAFFCAHLALMLAAVLLVGRRPVQWVAPVLLLAGCFLLEWFAPMGITWRAVMAFGGVSTVVGTITVAATATSQSSARFRLLQVLTVGYRCCIGRTTPVVSPAILGRLIVETMAAGIACVVLAHLVHLQLSVSMVAFVRWLAGIILFYAVGEFVADLVRFGFLATGNTIGPIHETPVAARSLGDFWGNRWNHAVSAWFYRFVFSPLARRRHPNLGLVCAFLVSGAMHAWVPWVALGPSAGLSVFAFFCLQGVFFLAENRLHVPDWPRPLARIWTLGILLVTSQLFVPPFLSLVHL